MNSPFTTPIASLNVNLENVFQALSIAAFAHRSEKRKSTIKSLQMPYINHPIGVAHDIIAALSSPDIASFMAQHPDDGWVESAVIAAIMHDTVENNRTEAMPLITAHISPRVSAVIDEVTDPDDMPKDVAARKAKQAEKARSYSLAATNVKIADQTQNLIDSVKLKPNWTHERHTQYAEGAKAIVFSTPEAFRIPKLVDNFMRAYNEVLLMVESA